MSRWGIGYRSMLEPQQDDGGAPCKRSDKGGEGRREILCPQKCADVSKIGSARSTRAAMTTDMFS